MESCTEAGCKPQRKRLFIILLTLLSLTSQTSQAESPYPTTPQLSAYINALPIFANTLTTYNNLKSLATEAKTVSGRLADRRQFVAWYAESFADGGYRYRYGGTNIESGIDCSGFTQFVLNYFNIKAGRCSRSQYAEGTKIPVSEARAGDLVFFGHKYINHVAMVLSNGPEGLFIVHSTYRGIVRENVYESKYWKSKLRDMAVNIIDGN